MSQRFVNFRMMRASLSPPSRDSKRQRVINRYEEKIAEEDLINKNYQPPMSVKQPKIILPISHIHDSVRLSNFRH